MKIYVVEFKDKDLKKLFDWDMDQVLFSEMHAALIFVDGMSMLLNRKLECTLHQVSISDTERTLKLLAQSLKHIGQHQALAAIAAHRLKEAQEKLKAQGSKESITGKPQEPMQAIFVNKKGEA